MSKPIAILVILCFSFKTHAQQLLANGSLDERNTCTEYKALCAPEAWFFIPTYLLNSPREDSNYFEVLSMGSLARVSPAGKRNYLYSKILCKLQPGKQYNFGVWIKTAGNKFDHLDVWLGAREPNHLRLIRETFDPAFTLTTAHEDSSRGDWKKYSYRYTAKGEEQFLMLGNLSVEGMDKSKAKKLSEHKWVLYGIDNISMSSVDHSANTCPEYSAVWKQVYEQNNRHPARLIEAQPLDTSLVVKQPAPKKEIVWVIVDTPPSMRKKLADTLVIPDVLFHFNSSTLNPRFAKELDLIIDKLKDRQFSSLEITGHTDDRGTSAYNLELSGKRAQSIKAYLLRKLDIKTQLVTTAGMGEKIAIASNATAEGRQKNRRVEIVLKN